MADNTKRAARLERLGKKYQKELQLQDWQVEFHLVPKMPEDYAQVHYSEAHQAAIIRVGEDVLEKDWPEKLVHELFHLWQAQIREITDRLTDELSKEAREIYQGLVEEAFEAQTYKFCRVYLGKPVQIEL